MIAVERISQETVPVFKAVRLRALQDSPKAFGSTYARESQLSDADWLHRATQYTGDKTVGYLAMDAETPCGIVRATLDDQDPSAAWVESMWVAPLHRRLGVGRLLIDAVIAWANGRGVRTLKLEVTSNNDPAIRFYQRLGFSRTGYTRPYPNDPALVECEMTRPL